MYQNTQNSISLNIFSGYSVFVCSHSNINFESVHIYQFQFNVELKTPLKIRYIYRREKKNGRNEKKNPLTHTATDKILYECKIL